MANEKYTRYLGDSYDSENGLDMEKAKRKVLSEKEKLNIVLMGATGVGKSSLVNAVFGSDTVKTGSGKPITQHLEKVIVPEKGLTLWDTKGIEAEAYQETRQQLLNDIENGIRQACESKNDNDMPHVAWLCIKESSKRIEERELDLLRMMENLGIPTVVVFTNMQFEDGEEFFAEAQKILNEAFPSFIKNRYVRVNSIPYKIAGHTIPTKGLEDLLQMTENCLQESQQFSEKQRKKHLEALRKAQIIDMEKKLASMIDSAKTKVHVAALAAGAAGVSPIPMSDAPIIAGIQGTMIYTISSEFELELDKSLATSMIAGLLGVTGLAQVGRTVVSNVLKFIPGVGTALGGAISGTTAAGLTEALGHAYIEVLKYFFNKETGKVELPSEADVIDTDAILEVFRMYFKK